MQPGPHQPCNSLLLSGLSVIAKPQTTKALNISLKLTQNLSWLHVMPVCAWAVKVVHPISRLCNLKLQLIEPGSASSPFCSQSQKPLTVGTATVVLPNSGRWLACAGQPGAAQGRSPVTSAEQQRLTAAGSMSELHT